MDTKEGKLRILLGSIPQVEAGLITAHSTPTHVADAQLNEHYGFM